jgi:uncharacterized membrane protein (UPF0127 family)
MKVHHAVLLALAVLCTSACMGADEGDVKFETVQVKIKERSFTLEVADTEARRSRGLMFRKSMAADHGMIFVFEKADTWGFWMKNTEIALDLVFLDEGGKVIGIYPLKPHDETSVGPDKPAKFAIELNAGTAKAVGLKVGDRVDLPKKLLKGGVGGDDK